MADTARPLTGAAQALPRGGRARPLSRRWAKQQSIYANFIFPPAIDRPVLQNNGAKKYFRNYPTVATPL
jgi:hypothetical protein